MAERKSVDGVPTLDLRRERFIETRDALPQIGAALHRGFDPAGVSHRIQAQAYHSVRFQRLRRAAKRSDPGYIQTRHLLY